MSAQPLRKINIQGRTYLWRAHHRHRELCADGEQRCSDVFTAFQREFGRRALRVLFPETSEHGPGYPGQHCVVVDYRNPTRVINLNRPRVARLLIELAIAAGWSPALSRGEFVVRNGYQLLREHAAELDAALASAP